MKTTISITVDTEVKAEIDGKHLNVSGKCNEFLRSLLELPDSEINKDMDLQDLKVKIASRKAEVSELEKIYKERDEGEGWID